MSRPSHIYPNRYKDQSQKRVDEYCSTRITPYFVEKDGSLSMFLGLDKKHSEWTPFGGSCSESRGACSRHQTSLLKSCLRRELSEESKNIIDLNETVDFVNCKFIHYVTRLAWANLHNNVYFAQWSGGDKEKISKYFNDKERDEKLHTTLKSRGKSSKEINAYFEMETISFIPITHEVFGLYIYNTIQDFYVREESYRKDKIFYNQVSDIFSSLFKTYPKKDVGDTDGKRFDPRFLLGIIDAVSDYFMKEFKYRNVDDIVDDIVKYIRGIQRGCLLDGQRLNV